MSLVDDIKRKASREQPQCNTDAEDIAHELNKLFYLPKKPKEELMFIKQLFTRGLAQTERVGLHASAMIVSDNEFCVRQQVLSLLYKQEQGAHIEPNLKRIFEEGNAIHEKWQRLFIRGGLGEYTDMDKSQMVDKYELSFTPDALITINGRKYVCEIKSMNTHAYKHATSHPSGAKQCQLYMHFTKTKRGFVLAEDKNDQTFKVFPLVYDRAIVAPFIERLEEVKYCKERLINEGRIVGKHPDCSSYLCKKALKCPMRDACFGKGKGRELLVQ